MATEPRLTVISLEWDHGYRSIAVDRSPGFPAHLVRLLDPHEVGLSDKVVERLEDWRVRKTELAARSDGDVPEEDIDELRRAHHRLAEALHQLARDVARELCPGVSVQLYRGRVDVEGDLSTGCD